MANRRKDRPVPDGYTRYTGEYEKQWYDIITIIGNKYQGCWPNAGNFISCCDHTIIRGDAVFAIKMVDNPFEREVL